MSRLEPLRLGVNIDHVATLRNARRGAHPDTLRAALTAQEAGADGITVHLREDRRHIRDEDVARIKAQCPLPLNLEMAATDEMLDMALKMRPNACCLVPERRAELTTEGGLDVAGHQQLITHITARLREAGIRVSLFIDPDHAQLEAAAACGADIVELHTGAYSEAVAAASDAVGAGQGCLRSLNEAAEAADRLGLECHAGHGLRFETVGAVAAIPQMRELNIGHFLIGEAVFLGLAPAIRKMRQLMDAAR